MQTKRTKSAGGVVVNQKEQVLVVNQGGRSWSLPKGHIDEGEDAFTAAKREIFEESGIRNLKFIKELESYERHKIGFDTAKEDVSELKTIYMFLFKTNEEKLALLDPHHPEARWIEKTDVADPLTYSKDKDFFRANLKNIF